MGNDSEEVQQQVGCGSGSGTDLSQITLNINTTTGGSFSVNVDNQISVENLKKIIAKKLKVAKDRICLLHREKVLVDGTSVKENGILNGSRIILLPNVETGLLAQRPENTVMQALESLNDSQVNDFLSGKTPLNLSMRLGDHMMLIQLQLSTVNPTGSSSSASTSGTSLDTSGHSSRDVAKHLKHMKSLSNLNLFGNRSKAHSSRPSSSSHQLSSPIKFSNVTATGGECSTTSNSNSSPSKNNLEDLSQIVNALEKVKQRQEIASSRLISEHSMDTSDTEQSPIKSLSNLVSSPLNASSLKSIHLKPTSSSKSTSCPCKSTQNTDNAGIGCDINCQYSQTYSQVAHKRTHLINQTELKSLTRSSAFLHKTINNPISKTRSFNYTGSSQQVAECSTSTAHIRRSKSSEIITNQEQGIAQMLATKLLNKEPAIDQPISIIDATAGSSIDDVATGTTETLAEASRNLTKTLRKLSKEVFSTKSESSVGTLQEEKRSRTSNSTSNVHSNGSGSQQNSSAVSGLGSGAVIESMRNHGRGIYSGTFSGTLNPALQDRFGRPKRDISTVIHILNDLLSATPHYSRGARISFEPAHSSRSSKYASSSKRSSGSGSSNQTSHSRSQCTKCSPLSRKSGECSADCVRAHRSSGSRSSSTIVTNDLKHRITSKSTSLPTTPVSKLTSIDCRQCQMPLLSNSAPVTPTKESIDQIAHLNKSDISLLSNTSLDSSNVSSNYDFRNSSNDLSMCSPLLANAMNQSTISTNSPICTKCSNMEMENNKTKTKLDQLRLVMQQRRERREARKLRSAPYGGRIIGAAATATTSNSPSNPTNQNDSANNATVISASVDGLPSNPIVEQVNTLA